jgi:hypothetical protein
LAIRSRACCVRWFRHRTTSRATASRTLSASAASTYGPFPRSGAVTVPMAVSAVPLRVMTGCLSESGAQGFLCRRHLGSSTSKPRKPLPASTGSCQKTGCAPFCRPQAHPTARGQEGSRSLLAGVCGCAADPARPWTVPRGQPVGCATSPTSPATRPAGQIRGVLPARGQRGDGRVCNVAVGLANGHAGARPLIAVSGSSASGSPAAAYLPHTETDHRTLPLNHAMASVTPPPVPHHPRPARRSPPPTAGARTTAASPAPDWRRGSN